MTNDNALDSSNLKESSRLVKKKIVGFDSIYLVNFVQKYFFRLNYVWPQGKCWL